MKLFDKEMIKKAIEIKQAAAKKWACDSKEIWWPACVSMAFKGERIEVVKEEKKFEVEPIKVLKKGIEFVIEITPAVSSGEVVGRIEVNGHGSFLTKEKGQNVLKFYSDYVLEGKKYQGISIDETTLKQINAQIKRAIDFKIAQDNAVEVQAYKISHSTTYGYSVSTIPPTSARQDVKEANDVFKKVAKDVATEAKITAVATKKETEMDDYSITDDYELTPAAFATLIAELKGFAEEKEVEKKASDAKKEAEKKAEISKMDDNEFVRAYFCEQIHVAEDGTFSECPGYCDDCFFVTVWREDAPEDVRKSAGSYEVESKKGKVYTYKKCDEKSLEAMIAKHADLISAKRSEVTK